MNAVTNFEMNRFEDIMKIALPIGGVAKRLKDAISFKRNYFRDAMFSGNRLSGPIPPQIGPITTLTDMLLSANNFTGPIHESFSNLKSLTDLKRGYEAVGAFSKRSISHLMLLPWTKLQGALKERPNKTIAKLMLLSSTTFKIDEAIMLIHELQTLN